MTIAEFQRRIADIYLARDSRRGVDGTFRWLIEETGELARALRSGDRHNLAEEFADVFAWLVSLATQKDIDLEKACQKYSGGCPKCRSTPCVCSDDSGK
ncbi:MAG: MazG nucleotide pyrophosphohydrolase domain-containing protein [candidate division WOR-3 bacterium]